jgi:hypothetical protein
MLRHKPAVNEVRLRRRFDGRLRVTRNNHPHGIGRVREMGARLATGDLVWALDDDDLLSAGVISSCDEVFRLAESA